MKFNVITIFPELISQYCEESILGRAQASGIIFVNPVYLRDFTDDRHHTVDDTPYGGGAGMVMKPEPIYLALKSLDAIPFHKVDGLSKVKKIFTGGVTQKKRTILLSPRGRQFDERLAEEWSRFAEITFVCGRYEGVDQRVADYMVDEEISIGPYVLAGGELGALVIIEAVARLLPSVVGNPESLREETFAISNGSYHGVAVKASAFNNAAEPKTSAFNNAAEPKTSAFNNAAVSNATVNDVIAAEYPQYTKPAEFRGWKVPDILLSGDHSKISDWRRAQWKK